MRDSPADQSKAPSDMPLFRRKRAESVDGDEVRGEIKESKKWIHRPASECPQDIVQYLGSCWC